MPPERRNLACEIANRSGSFRRARLPHFDAVRDGFQQLKVLHAEQQLSSWPGRQKQYPPNGLDSIQQSDKIQRFALTLEECNGTCRKVRRCAFLRMACVSSILH